MDPCQPAKANSLMRQLVPIAEKLQPECERQGNDSNPRRQGSALTGVLQNFAGGPGCSANRGTHGDVEVLAGADRLTRNLARHPSPRLTSNLGYPRRVVPVPDVLLVDGVQGDRPGGVSRTRPGGLTALSSFVQQRPSAGDSLPHRDGGALPYSGPRRDRMGEATGMGRRDEEKRKRWQKRLEHSHRRARGRACAAC